MGAFNRIDLVFSEGDPKTGERYAVTVYSREVADGEDTLVPSWYVTARTVTTSGSNKKLSISTASVSPPWPGPGKPRQLLLASAQPAGCLIASFITAEAASTTQLIVIASSSLAAGRYLFVVHAGNAAGGDTGYNVASPKSDVLRVGEWL